MSQTGFKLRSSSRGNSKIPRAESAEGSYGQAAWRRDFRVSDGPHSYADSARRLALSHIS
jgi:hypothetical protein